MMLMHRRGLPYHNLLAAVDVNAGLGGAMGVLATLQVVPESGSAVGVGGHSGYGSRSLRCHIGHVEMVLAVLAGGDFEERVLVDPQIRNL